MWPDQRRRSVLTAAVRRAECWPRPGLGYLGCLLGPILIGAASTAVGLPAALATVRRDGVTALPSSPPCWRPA